MAKEIRALQVSFQDAGTIADPAITFVVIAARYEGRWIMVRHKDRATWEIPGGHREPHENPERAARRELREETGALEYDFAPVCAYSVAGGGCTSHGVLYFAEVRTMGPLPDSEIGEIRLVNDLPAAELTYPAIQPLLYRKVLAFLAGM